MSTTEKIIAAYEAAPVVNRSKLISDVRRLSGLARDVFETELRKLWETTFRFEPVHSAVRIGLSQEQCDGLHTSATRFVWIERR